MPESFERRQSFQTIAWFRDLYRRNLLDLDPPYQRRSVWNQTYRDFFIETILLRYPAPAIFVHESISPQGLAKYSVVDGKQRLTTIFDFTDDLFPVSDASILPRLASKSFADLDDSVKQAFWTYQFSVEYLPTTDESTLTNVFDRINRNVARLQRQELRHARFDGTFATAVERLNDLLIETFGFDVPRIAPSSRRQMKDVELVAQLLLLIENGPQSFSQDDLDDAYSSRDGEWVEENDVEQTFRQVVTVLKTFFKSGEAANAAMRRLRNQADFYSFFGALVELVQEASVPSPAKLLSRTQPLMEAVVNEDLRSESKVASEYFAASRSASNDLRQRLSRIATMRGILTGETVV